MSRSACLLITALLLAAGNAANAQQSNTGTADEGASQITNTPAPLPDSAATPPVAPDPAAAPEPGNQPAPPAVTGADSLIPPSQGAPTPGPESLARTAAPSSASQAPKSSTVRTKPPSDQPVSKSMIQAIAVQPPPEDSPFFIERQEARDAAAKAGREGYGMYVPKPPKPPAQQQIKQFFSGLFGHGKKWASEGPAPLKLTVDPSDFSLSQTPELDVSLKVTAAGKHELEFLFPDNQRIEIDVKDEGGAVISHWSEDRAFDKRLGFTEINPSEFVVFAERVSTGKMKAGQSYTVEVSLANQQGYSASATVTPKP